MLAVLASRFLTPLDSQVANILVQQLLLLLQHNLEMHRSAAAELLGKGYHIWRLHLNDPSVLICTLFRLSVTWDAEALIAAGVDPGSGGRTATGGEGKPPSSPSVDAARPSQNCFQADKRTARMDYLLPTWTTTYCLLPSACCFLPSACCLLPVARMDYCPLPTICCPLPAIYRLLSAACCPLPAAWCRLSTC